MLRIFTAAVCATLLQSAIADDFTRENLFQKGLAAYQNKQYPEARDAFQKLLDEGVVSAKLFHNLALTEYQMDQKPLALALWRKALSLDPSLRQARAGREFAEGGLQVRGWERDQLNQLVYRNLESISFFELLWLVAFLLGCAGWLWIRFFADRRTALTEERPLPPFPSAAVILTLLLVICAALSAGKARQEWRVRATVIAKGVNARALPAEDGVGLFELRGGAEVLVRRQAEGWKQVQNSEGASGWVKDSDVLVTSSN
ncbi:MAG TPA: hypothetical protein PKC28_11445 [Bdellovibrionales bacterium]|nr:hypothetical protein [Bdellovibrionales bacterium]